MTYEFKSPAPFAFDRRSPRSEFIRSRKAETQYGLQLRKIARVVGDIVKTLWDESNPVAAANAVEDALRRYSSTLDGWAAAVGRRMVADVAARDRKAWMEISRRMGLALREEIETAPTGLVVQQRLAEQVTLIKSLPTEAAERVHKLTLEGIVQGRRAEAISKEIQRSGEVTKSRANTIARTEVSRTATELTRARAEHVGSEGYIWRTAGDSDVRDSHQAMNGKFVRWDDPPTLDGLTGHAGALPNCRCYCEPVIPDA